MNYTITKTSLLIFLVLIGVFSSSIVLATDTKTTDLNSSTYQIGSGFIDGDAQSGLFSLLSFLHNIGLDISYGDEGETVFSMIDYSLLKIIRDLSSGNASGIQDNPLINETFQYFDINESDIIIKPEDVSGDMEATWRYYDMAKNTEGT